MISRISYSIFENIAIVWCVCCLYQKYPKIDKMFVGTCILLSTISGCIIFFGWPDIFIAVQHFLLLSVCRHHFHADMRQLIVNTILYFIIIGGIELFLSFLTESIQLALCITIPSATVGFASIGILFLLHNLLNFHQISQYLTKSNLVIRGSLFLMAFCVTAMIIRFVVRGNVDTLGWIIFAFLLIIIQINDCKYRNFTQ